MTSIATFISNLAGGAPQDPAASPANASGKGGIFAALLAATGATPAGEGEIAAIPNPLNAEIASPEEQPVLVTAEGDALLRQALTEGLGLPQEGAEIDAAIIDKPLSADAAAAILLPEGASQITEGLDLTTAPEVAVQAGQSLQPAPDQSTASIAGQNTPGSASDVQAQQANRPQDPGAAARTAGVENGLNKPAREGGLETAGQRPAQSAEKGEGQRAGLAHSDDPARARGVAAPGDAPSRSDFASNGPRIIQQIVKPGSGQTLIKFQQPTGADPAGLSSPPTLTVSVPAHAASPSPASANVPHVPVSALAVHIAQQARNGAKRFDIRLDPPELGRIEVRLEVSREGQVMTHLVVERSETLDLLQRDARQLERALQDAGLNTSKDDMKFSLKDQDLAQGGSGQGNPEGDSGSFKGESGDPLSLIPNAAMPPPTRYLASTGLDIRI